MKSVPPENAPGLAARAALSDKLKKAERQQGLLQPTGGHKEYKEYQDDDGKVTHEVEWFGYTSICWSTSSTKSRWPSTSPRPATTNAFRATKQSERLFAGRTAVEPVNGRLKVFWGINYVQVYGARRSHAHV